MKKNIRFIIILMSTLAALLFCLVIVLKSGPFEVNMDKNNTMPNQEQGINGNSTDLSQNNVGDIPENTLQTPGSTQIVNTDVYRDINQKIEYTDDNLSKIDKLLGLDFRKTLIDTYYKEMQNSTDDYGNIVFKSKQDIDDAGMMPAGIGIGEPIMTSFTGEKSDYGYVIIGEIQLSQVKWTKKFVLSFVRDEMGFTPKFMKVSDYDIKVKLIDINSDDKYEIAVEHFAGDGLKASHSILSVWTYKNDDFKAIFENDLSEFDRDFPYSYNNKYEFRKIQIIKSLQTFISV